MPFELEQQVQPELELKAQGQELLFEQELPGRPEKYFQQVLVLALAQNAAARPLPSGAAASWWACGRRARFRAGIHSAVHQG